jgi:hypothetical protein
MGDPIMLKRYATSAARGCAWLLIAGTFTAAAWGGTVDLGRGWSAASPNGYEVAKDGADLNIGTTLGQPIKQIVNWSTLGEVKTSFVNNSKSTDAPQPLDHFLLRMEFTNNTGVAWSGFRFTLIDDNATVNTEGLFHPSPAHFHTDFMDPNDVGFTSVTSNPAYNDLGQQRGVYSFTVFDGFTVLPGQTWKPTAQAMKQLDLHDKLKFMGEQNITAFTLIEQPLTPLPSAAVMGLVLLGGLLCKRRRVAG